MLAKVTISQIWGKINRKLFTERESSGWRNVSLPVFVIETTTKTASLSMRQIYRISAKDIKKYVKSGNTLHGCIISVAFKKGKQKVSTFRII